jgi:hypothetical protein
MMGWNSKRGESMAEEPAQRYFTVDEANAALQIIRPLVARILEIRTSIIEKQPEMWAVIEKAAGNGGSKRASEIELEFERIDGLIQRIRATGAIVKEVNVGLVDFLSLREGREVFLCWQYGEQEVEFWHDVDAGFAGRQRIEPS